MALGKRATVGTHPDELKEIVRARDRMASERRRTVHILAVIQWYRNVQLRSSTGPVAPTPVVLTRPDLLEDLWWKDRFQDEKHSIVPVIALIGNSDSFTYLVVCIMTVMGSRRVNTSSSKRISFQPPIQNVVDLLKCVVFLDSEDG